MCAPDPSPLEVASDAAAGRSSGQGVSADRRTISIVICTLGRLEPLDACLAALRRQSLPADETIIVLGPTEGEEADRFFRSRRELRLERVDRRNISVARNVGMRAARGDIVVFFGTGPGQTTPGGTDGQIATPPIPTLLAETMAWIGGVPAEVVYSGPAPGLAEGVWQLNARIASGSATGLNVDVRAKVGDQWTQPGVTISIDEQ